MTQFHSRPVPVDDGTIHEEMFLVPLQQHSAVPILAQKRQHRNVRFCRTFASELQFLNPAPCRQHRLKLRIRQWRRLQFDSLHAAPKLPPRVLELDHFRRKQKGSGNARHGSAKAPQFRGGGRAFGPIARSHAHDLPKKVRLLALKLALSAKAKESQIIVLDKAEVGSPKTKELKDTFGKLGLSNALIIGGAEVQDNFLLASRAIPNIDVLPVQGINVYDILRREKLVLTTAALDALSQRLAG